VKVIYLDHNFIESKYKNSPKDGSAFFTYGFGSLYAREFKKYNPDWDVECWKADTRISNPYVKRISNVQYRMFPATKIPYMGVFSKTLINELKTVIKDSSGLIINISNLGHLLLYQVAKQCSNTPLFVQGHGETTAKMDLRIRKGILRKLKALIHIPFENRAVKNIKVYYALDKKMINEMPSNFKGEFLIQTTGVDPNLFKPIDKQEAKKMLNLNPNKKYIVFIGRLDYTKRPDMLLDAWEELKHRFPEWELLLAGNSSGMPLTSRAKELGVIVMGRILQTELYKYLSAASIYVLAHLKGIYTLGGVGMLPVQALFCETPVVGYTVKNIPEEIRSKLGICTNNKVELTEALQQIMTGNFCFKNLREIAIQEYSWENISKRTCHKYLEYIS